MGLNFSYLLYFKREDLWKTLQGFLLLAEDFDPPTKIFFPGQVLEIPLEHLAGERDAYKYNDSEFKFFVCIPFEEDPTLAEYYKTEELEGIKRSPPESGKPAKITICEIILTIHQEIPEDTKNEFVLFEFDTVGTWMSLLFEQSTSIRRTFIEFLEKFDGVCGVFNMEFGGGEVFWHKGRQYNLHIDDQFMLPEEIERIHHTKLLK